MGAVAPLPCPRGLGDDPTHPGEEEGTAVGLASMSPCPPHPDPVPI